MFREQLKDIREEAMASLDSMTTYHISVFFPEDKWDEMRELVVQNIAGYENPWQYQGWGNKWPNRWGWNNSQQPLCGLIVLDGSEPKSDNLLDFKAAYEKRSRTVIDNVMLWNNFLWEPSGKYLMIDPSTYPAYFDSDKVYIVATAPNLESLAMS